MSVFGVFLVCIFQYLDWIRRDTEYSVPMRENAGQNNSKYGHFLRSVYVWHVYIPKCLEHLLNKTFEKFDVVISFIFCYCLCSLEDYHGLKIYIIKLIHWYVIKIIDFQVWWKFYSKWTLFAYDRGLHVPKKMAVFCPSDTCAWWKTSKTF